MSRLNGLCVACGLALWGAAGCSGEKVEESAPPVETEPQETADDNCDGINAPVIVSMELENTGLQRFENDDLPTLTVWVEAEDEDYDLASYKLEVYYDADIDGVVEANSTHGFSNSGTLSDDGTCTARGGTVGLTLGLAGGGIEYDTLTEFGAIITDGHGMSSEMSVISGYTPTSTGEDGGP